MKQFIFFLSLVWCCLSLAAQSDVTLTFSCQTEDGNYIQPDSIVIQNVDREWSDRIFYPDTVYQLIVGTDVRENVKIDGIAVTPNPFRGETNVRFALEGGKDVLVEVVDLSGHPLATATAAPNEPGIYSFRVALSKNGVYLLSVKQAGKTTTTKLVNVGKGGGNALKLQNFTAEFGKTEASTDKAISPYPFQLGDEMIFNGYASGEVSKATVYHPFENDSITLVFGCPYLGDGLPCQNTPTVTDYDGNIYTTVKVGCQCWLKENLRTTHYADGTEISLGGDVASTTEPQYWSQPGCHLELQDRGYLYNWVAVVKDLPIFDEEDTLDTPPGTPVQGICPNGWHVPSLADGDRMFDYLDTHTEYLCNGWLGQNGKALASQTGWPYSYYTCTVGHDTLTNNTTGFSLFSAGYCVGSTYDNAGAFLWTSDYPGIYVLGVHERAYALRLSSAQASMYSFVAGAWTAMAVRCLRDEDIQW